MSNAALPPPPYELHSFYPTVSAAAAAIAMPPPPPPPQPQPQLLSTPTAAAAVAAAVRPRPPLERQLCRDALRGACARGPSHCRFPHPPPEALASREALAAFLLSRVQ